MDLCISFSFFFFNQLQVHWTFYNDNSHRISVRIFFLKNMLRNNSTHRDCECSQAHYCGYHGYMN